MTRPDYIRRGGELVMAPPLRANGATMYAFLVRADLGALTRMVDAHLNAVTAPSGTIYKPLLPMAAIVCSDMPRSFSTSPPDSDKGWATERDFGVWIPVVAGTMSGGAWKAGRIGWYIPYMFVDSVAAMATGREVYGCFKQTAALAMPPTPSSPGMFSIDALVIPKFTPSSQAETLRLLTVTPCEPAVAARGEWTSLREAVEAVWSKIKHGFFDGRSPAIGDGDPDGAAGGAGGKAPRGVDGRSPAIGDGDPDGAGDLPVTAWDILKNLVEDLVTGDVPLVFLKQFHDATDAAKACYQAVIEAPAHVDKFYTGWITHPHDVAITPCDSHPIVAECGLAGPQVRSELGFWCRMDFTMQPGKVISEAS